MDKGKSNLANKQEYVKNSNAPVHNVAQNPALEFDFEAGFLCPSDVCSLLEYTQKSEYPTSWDLSISDEKYYNDLFDSFGIDLDSNNMIENRFSLQTNFETQSLNNFNQFDSFFDEMNQIVVPIPKDHHFSNPCDGTSNERSECYGLSRNNTNAKNHGKEEIECPSEGIEASVNKSKPFQSSTRNSRSGEDVGRQCGNIEGHAEGQSNIEAENQFHKGLSSQCEYGSQHANSLNRPASSSNAGRNDNLDSVFKLSLETQGLEIASNDFDKIESDFIGQKKILGTVDWLQVRLKSESFGIGDFVDGGYRVGDYFFELLEGGTKMYRHRANVWYGHSKRDKIGVICFDSSLPVHRHTITYKLENFVFYDEIYAKTFNEVLLDNVFKALEADYLNITRLDFAFDGVDYDKFLNDFALYGKYEKLGVQNFLPMAYDIEAKQFNAFRVGVRSGKKMVRYYDKTREIFDTGSKKDYILDYFQLNGFDIEKGVKRLEFQFRSGAFKDIKGFKLTDVFDVHKMCEFVKLHSEKFFDFVSSDSNDSVKSRRERINILDLRACVRGIYTKVQHRVKDTIRTAKIMVKRLIRSAVLEDDSMAFHFLKSAAKIMDENRLFSWVVKKDEFIRKEVQLFCKSRGFFYYDHFGNEDMGTVLYNYLNAEI